MRLLDFCDFALDNQRNHLNSLKKLKFKVNFKYGGGFWTVLVVKQGDFFGLGVGLEGSNEGSTHGTLGGGIAEDL